MATQPFLNNPRAFMGYVGFVKIVGGTINGNGIDANSTITHDPYLIRATSADINLTQEITKPDVVDSRYDRSVYQLGPKLVDGSMSFPVLYEVPASTVSDKTLFEIMYRYAVTRDPNGELSPFNMKVKYDSSGNADFKYVGCIVNNWKFSVAQSDVVTCDIDVIGIDREPAEIVTPPRKQLPNCVPGEADSTAAGSIGTSRIVTWNDARVELSGGRITSAIGGQYIRTFECNIANDAERFYSLNTVLAPQHIAPRKRDVTGSMTLIGRHPNLSDVALKNQDNCTETSNILFGYNTTDGGEGCSASTFNVTLPNVLYEIETLSLTNDIFESTINWHSLPSAGTGVCDPLLTVGDAVFTYPPSTV